MKLLIVTQYFPPETGAPQNRLFDFARRMVDAGHEVTVLTALPNYPADRVYPDYRGRGRMRETMDGINVARVPLYVPRKRTFARRMANYLSFSGSALALGYGLIDRADVVLMESPPLFVAPSAVAIARAMRAPLVVNVSDLWPKSAVELGVVSPGPSLRAAQALEAWMYRSADLVFGQTEGIVDDIRARFPATRASLFPNGVAPERLSLPDRRDEVRRELGWSDDDFAVVYTGVIGLAQALDQVLDAADLLREHKRIRFDFFGDGPCLASLRAAAAERGLASVTFHGHRPASAMPGIQSAMDAGLVPLARGPVFEGARPSKMFEIMAAGRPLVLCARGEAARVVAAAPGEIGAVVPPESPEQLAAVIRDWSAAPERCRMAGESARAYVRERFDRARIATQVEREILGVLDRQRGKAA